MPQPSSSRRSSRSGTSSEKTVKASDRKEKAKSSQLYDTHRRGSKQAESALRIVHERPSGKGRTNSAPLVDARELSGSKRSDDKEQDVLKGKSSSTPEGGIGGIAQDEDEVAGVCPKKQHFEPFKTSELSQPLLDINIAVIGAEGCGKSTFVQRALDLPVPPSSQAAERRISIDGIDYLIRLLELPIDEIVIDEDDTVSWPETIEDKIMPKIDGALTLYDVKDRVSLECIPEMLNAINKSGLPSVLVSCKCDARPEELSLNPRDIEMKAKQRIKNLQTLQTSAASPDTNKRGLSLILQAIMAGAAVGDHNRSSSANRQRAQSTAVRPVSPRPPNDRGHNRATSEYTGSLFKDQRHSRHDSSLATHSSNDQLKKLPEQSQEDMHGSFLIEASASEASTSVASTRSSSLADGTPDTTVGAQSSSSFSENGVHFDELVDRLLVQPTSKADDRFVAIFLALYRKFAAPGRLLEAIVLRFDSLDRTTDVDLVRTVSQMRYLNLMQKWLSAYPGDFAHSSTKRRMRTFVGKLYSSRIFAAAAKAMGVELDSAHEDDDTNWAYCDKDRTSIGSEFRGSLFSTASTLIDDPTFLFSDDLSISALTLHDDSTLASNSDGKIAQSMSSASLSMLNVEAAQRQAVLLQPIPRQPVTKIQWRSLMDYTEDDIARELTRMDWTMFCAIRPRDLVRHVSLSKEQQSSCKNLVHVNIMIDHFQQLAFWVQNYVLLRDKPKHRAMMMEKFMRIARKLRELNNYNSLGAIIAGINATPTFRLLVTRDIVPTAIRRDWTKLEMLMSHSRSHFAYRLAWENSSSERIPYLPIHRRDLVSAEEGNKTFIGDEKDGKINWKKFEVMGDAILSIQKAQETPYKNLTAASRPEWTIPIKELVLDVKLVKDDDELDLRSHQVEPHGTGAGTSAKFKDFFKR